MPLTLLFPGLPGGTDSLLMSEAELLNTFGIFLSVLIALELVETVEVYFKDHEIHAEIVLLVALIALARKVVLLDIHSLRSAARSSGSRPCSSASRLPTPRSAGSRCLARNATTASSPSSSPGPPAVV